MEVKNIIHSYFIKQDDVLCVYLFGSVAAGKEHERSDVDMAVLFDESVKKERYFEKKMSIADDISRRLDKNADIIILNEADAFLKFQVFKNGVRVYEREDRSEHNFEAKALLEYFDFLPIRQRMEEALIKRIKEA